MSLNDNRDLQLLTRPRFLSRSDEHTLLMLDRLGPGDRDGILVLEVGPSCNRKNTVDSGDSNLEIISIHTPLHVHKHKKWASSLLNIEQFVLYDVRTSSDAM